MSNNILITIQAVKYSSRAVQLSKGGSLPEAHHLHGSILKDLGRLKEAEEVFVYSCNCLVDHNAMNTDEYYMNTEEY